MEISKREVSDVQHDASSFFLHKKLFYIDNFYNCIVPKDHWEIRVAFSRGKPAATESRYQTTVHAGCFSVSLIHRTLMWTTGSLTCARM